MAESLNLTHQRTLAQDVLAISSATMATLTGLTAYEAIDAVQTAFVLWCERHPHYATWMTAWTAFQASREAAPPVPRKPVQQQFEFGLFT